MDELNGIATMALLAPEEELEMIAAAAAACHPTGAVELAGTRGRDVYKKQFPNWRIRVCDECFAELFLLRLPMQRASNDTCFNLKKIFPKGDI